MRGTEVIGYTWQADMHCVGCTRDAYTAGRLKRDPEHPNSITGRDENGLPYDLADSEGNTIHPVFGVDEDADAECCGDCGDPLME